MPRACGLLPHALFSFKTTPRHPAGLTPGRIESRPSKRSVRGYVEPAAAIAAPEQSFQFERLGYFVADRRDHRPEAPVFNRSVSLRDTWADKA